MGAYTNHGHWLGDDEPTGPEPNAKARCGGPFLGCAQCTSDAVWMQEDNREAHEAVDGQAMKVALKTIEDARSGPIGVVPPGALWMASAFVRANKELVNLQDGGESAVDHEECVADAAAMAREVERVKASEGYQRGLVAAVRRLHSKRSYPGDGFTSELCVECRQAWPCPTIKALDGDDG